MNFDWTLRIEMCLDNLKDWFIKYGNWFKDPTGTENRIRSMFRELIEDVKSETREADKEQLETSKQLLQAIVNGISNFPPEEISHYAKNLITADLKTLAQQLENLQH